MREFVKVIRPAPSSRQLLQRSVAILQREPYRDLIAYVAHRLSTDPDYRRLHQWSIDGMVRRLLRNEGIDLSRLGTDGVSLLEEAFRRMKRVSVRAMRG